MKGKFIIRTDKLGNVTITDNLNLGWSVFFEDKIDRQSVIDLLSDLEKEMLQKGWPVEVSDTSNLASELYEIWKKNAKAKMYDVEGTARENKVTINKQQSGFDTTLEAHEYAVQKGWKNIKVTFR